MRPYNDLLKATFEIIAIKVLLNLVLIYFGKTMIAEEGKVRRFGLWMFTICLVLSFGLPGITITAPLFTLLSKWYAIAPYVSISVVVLFLFIFLYTFINTIYLFNPKHTVQQEKRTFSIKGILFVIMILVSLSISIWPDYIHYLSGNYYRTFIGRNY